MLSDAGGVLAPCFKGQSSRCESCRRTVIVEVGIAMHKTLLALLVKLTVCEVCTEADMLPAGEA